MRDKLITATAADNTLSITFCNMKDTCTEALKIHDLKGAAAEALCRTLIGGALLGSTLKNKEDIVTIMIRSEGPAGGITVTANNAVDVKGYIHHPQAEAETVSALLGMGILTVTKDIGLKEPYTGQLPLVTGEIAEDITAYFAESEQIQSSCGIGTRFNENGELIAAGGFLIQLLPDTPYEVIDQLEEDLTRHPSPPELILKYKDDYDKILVKMLPAFEIKILDEKPIKWECNCSRKRIEKALISLGKNELEAIIEEGNNTEVVCDFCRSKYNFTADEVKELYSQAI